MEGSTTTETASSHAPEQAATLKGTMIFLMTKILYDAILVTFDYDSRALVLISPWLIYTSRLCIHIWQDLPLVINDAV
jgi:hypothetical protein